MKLSNVLVALGSAALIVAMGLSALLAAPAEPAESTEPAASGCTAERLDGLTRGLAWAEGYAVGVRRGTDAERKAMAAKHVEATRLALQECQEGGAS